MTWTSLPPLMLAGIGEMGYAVPPPQTTINPAGLVVLPLAAVAVVLGYVFGREPGPRGPLVALWAVAAVLALPAVLLAAGYVRGLGLDEQPWFCEFRAATGTEYAAAGAGLAVGLLIAALRRRRFVVAPSAGFLCCLLAILLAVPYLKQWLAPGDFSRWQDRYEDGVCRQTTPSSCGPASAATVARALGVEAGERDFITDSHTTAGGTENWYLARALRACGLQVRYVKLQPPVQHLPSPAIAGTRAGYSHFIAVLGEDAHAYHLADPLTGPFDLPKHQVTGGRVTFTGFFMVVSRPEPRGAAEL